MTKPPAEMESEDLTLRHERWMQKPSLRAVYQDFVARIRGFCVDGTTLELGAGSSLMSDGIPDLVSSDIQPSPWVDLVFDAQAIPFRPESFANIVMIDVLHHLDEPLAMLRQARDVLQPGGRVIMIEPTMTPLSKVFYDHLHPEPVDMKADPYSMRRPEESSRPFDGNQAIPTIMFRRRPEKLALELPEFQLEHLSHLSLFAYPLTGGFKRWSAIPAGLVRPCLTLESWVLPLLGPLMAFRMLIVLKKNDGAGGRT